MARSFQTFDCKLRVVALAAVLATLTAGTGAQVVIGTTPAGNTPWDCTNTAGASAGLSAIAIGAGAAAADLGSISVGASAGAGASGTQNTAIGSQAGAGVTGTDNAAFGALAGQGIVGNQNISLGQSSGFGSQGDRNLFLGYLSGTGITGNSNFNGGEESGSYTLGDRNVAIGRLAGRYTHGTENVAIGAGAGSGSWSADPSTSPVFNRTVAVGGGARSSADEAIAVGSNAQAMSAGAVALGRFTQAQATNSVAVGAAALASGATATAVGSSSMASAENATALGASTTASGLRSTAVGAFATAAGADNIAIGAFSTSAAGQAVQVSSATIGGQTYAGFAGSASAFGVLSVGNTFQKRQIINVAPGALSATSTDAVNGSQLFSVASGLNARIDSLPTAGAGTPGPAGPQGPRGPQGSQGLQGPAGADATGSGPAEPAWITASPKTYTAPQAASANATAVGSGAVARGDNSVAIGTGSSDNGRANVVSVGAVGNERQLTNVAAGVMGTDGVNVNQLQEATTTSHNYTDARVNELASAVRSNRREASAGTAAAIALAGMPQAAVPGRAMVAGGVGVHDGEMALSMGGSKMLEDARGNAWVVKGGMSLNSRGRVSVGAGAGFYW